MLVKSFGACAAAALAFSVAGLANAANWGDKIDECVAAAEDEGIVEAADYDVSFDSGTSRRLSIELRPLEGGDDLYLECRFSRGRVVSVDLI